MTGNDKGGTGNDNDNTDGNVDGDDDDDGEFGDDDDKDDNTDESKWRRRYCDRFPFASKTRKREKLHRMSSSEFFSFVVFEFPGVILLDKYHNMA